MSAAPWVKPMRHAICAATLALAVIGPAGHAWAQAAAAATTQDEDLDDHVLNADKRLLDAILKPFGLGSSSGPDIIYRERSPLVVPQTRDLPPPGKVRQIRLIGRSTRTLSKRKSEAAAERRFNPVGQGPVRCVAADLRHSRELETGNTGSWADPPKPRAGAGFLQNALQRRPAGHVGGDRQVRGRAAAQLAGRPAARLSHALTGSALWHDPDAPARRNRKRQKL